MLFMGIDVGSSGCKVSVIDENGKAIGFSSREYSFTYSDSCCTLDAKMVFDNVLDSIKQLASEHDLSQLRTISATSFGEMFVLLDENLNVLTDSISYEDPRGLKELGQLTDSFGADEIYKITGASPDVMFSLPKLLWIKNNMPQVYTKAKYMCMFADYVLFKLGAEHHTDYSLAARTLMFDVAKKCWSDEIVKAAEIDKSILGKLVSSGTDVGKISKRVADDLSIPDDVTLLAGGHDQPCAALGAGIIKSGIALDGMGSNECIVPAFKDVMINDTMQASNLVCVPHIVPDLYVTYAFNRTSGSLFKWYNNITGNDGYKKLTEDIPDQPSNLFVLPHFAGAATPYMDDSSVGAVIGLKLSTTKGMLTKGIVEGLNYEMLVNLKCLEKANFKVEQLYVSGGMSRHDEILEIKADILGIPVTRLENSETGTIGTAILGGIAMGVFKDFEEAISVLVRSEKTFLPDNNKHELYKELFKKYEDLYETIKSFYNN